MNNLAQGVKQSGMVSTSVGLVDVNSGLMNLLSKEFHVLEIHDNELLGASFFSQLFPLTDIDTVLPLFPPYSLGSLENTDGLLSVDADMS